MLKEVIVNTPGDKKKPFIMREGVIPVDDVACRSTINHYFRNSRLTVQQFCTMVAQ